MSNNKQQIFCSYINYLDKNYPIFRESIDNTCTKKFLGVPKGHGFNGITLLIFKDRKVVDEFEDILNDFDGDSLERATNIMKSCIIYGHYPTIADFRENKDSIVTSAMKFLKVEKIENDKVILDGGVIITPDNEFHKNEPSASKVSIWLVEKGLPMHSDIPVELEKMNNETNNKRPRNNTSGTSKRGGGSNASSSKRNVIYNMIISAFHTYNEAYRKGEVSKRLPLLEYSSSLIHYIQTNYADLLPSALSVCNVGPCDIIFLLEPQSVIEPLIPDEVIVKWWAKKKSVPIIETYVNAFNSIKDIAYGQREEIIREMDKYRNKNIADNSTFEKLLLLYKTLETKNSLFNFENVFPKAVAERYKKYPYLKLNEDDRRLCWEIKFLWYDRARDRTHVKELKEVLDNIIQFNKNKSELTNKSTYIINAYKVKHRLDADSLKNIILPTYNSNAILYIPGITPLNGYADDAFDTNSDKLVDLNAHNIKNINSVYKDDIRPDVRDLDLYGVMGIGEKQ